MNYFCNICRKIYLRNIFTKFANITLIFLKCLQLGEYYFDISHLFNNLTNITLIFLSSVYNLANITLIFLIYLTTWRILLCYFSNIYNLANITLLFLKCLQLGEYYFDISHLFTTLFFIPFKDTYPSFQANFYS
jgi:hypothetical protein